MHIQDHGVILLGEGRYLWGDGDVKGCRCSLSLGTKKAEILEYRELFLDRKINIFLSSESHVCCSQC